MYNVLISLLLGILSKLVTADFFEKMILMGIHWIALKTTNELDNETGVAIAEALGKKEWYLTLK